MRGPRVLPQIVSVGGERLKTAITLVVGSVCSLLVLGFVMLYSAGTLRKDDAGFLTKQLIAAALGALVCAAMTRMDYALFKKLAIPMFLAAAVLLALVLVPGIGVKMGGARRWFKVVEGFNFQPSELGKLSLIVMLAWYCERFQRHMGTFWKGMAVPGCFIAVIAGLTFVEPDRGTSVLLAAVGCSILLLAGVKVGYLIPPGIAAVAGLAFSLWHDPVRARRILSWLHPEEHKQGVGFQSWQAQVALGSGGVQGVGLGDGRQKLGFVPEHQTDFIFSIIGEELGLIATLSVVVLFIIFVLAGIYIARHARDTFGYLTGAGITFLIGIQAFINIGVVTSVLPNKGLPLPFVSYGGSNLLLMMGCVGVLLSIARQGHEAPVEAEEPRRARPRKNPFSRRASAAAS